MDYGAIDLHARYSWIRIVTADGQAVMEQRVATTRDALRGVFAGRPALRVLVESRTESEWVAQTIEGCGHAVIVASPKYALMYGHRDPQIKTDRRDVRALAEACRLGIYRRAHRVGVEQRQRRRELRVREQLVRTRTQLINLVRAQLRQEGYRLPGGASHTVPRRYATVAVSEGLRLALAPVLTLLETIGAQLRTCDAQLKVAAAADGVVQRLMTAPGVGPITALTYRAVLDDGDAVRGCAECRGVSRAGPDRRQLRLSAAERRDHESGPDGAARLAGPSQLGDLAPTRRPRRRCTPGWSASPRAAGDALPSSRWRGGWARILYAMWRDGQDYHAVPVKG